MFISPTFLKAIFAGYVNLGWLTFFFFFSVSTLMMSFNYLLTCVVSLAAYKVLFLVFSSLTLICLCVVFFVFTLWDSEFLTFSVCFLSSVLENSQPLSFQIFILLHAFFFLLGLKLLLYSAIWYWHTGIGCPALSGIQYLCASIYICMP